MRSVNAAAAIAARADVDDAGTSLLNQVVALQAASRAVVFDDYQAEYESKAAEFVVGITAAIDGFYQQLHAATASAARLVGQRVTPTVDVKTLAGLDAEISRSPAHPLAARMRAIRRELELLRWLSTVRNKAVQHRSETGYYGNRAIILRSGVALLRKPDPPSPPDARKAKDLLRGLIRKHEVPLDPGDGDHEAVAYLDLLAHALFAIAPSDSDAARRVVQAARVHYVVASADVVNNADAALEALVELGAANPTSAASGKR